MGIKVSLALHACQDKGGVGCNDMLQETPIQTSCPGPLGNQGRLGTGEVWEQRLKGEMEEDSHTG